MALWARWKSTDIAGKSDADSLTSYVQADASGNGRSRTGVGTLSYKTNQYNGHPTVLYGSDGYWTFPDFFTNTGSGTGEFTFLWFGKTAAGNIQCFVGGDSSPDLGMWQHNGADSKLRLEYWGVATQVISASAAPVGSFATFAVAGTGNGTDTGTVYANGVADGSGSYAANTAVAVNRIGNNAFNYYLSGAHEVLCEIYDNKLSDADITARHAAVIAEFAAETPIVFPDEIPYQTISATRNVGAIVISSATPNPEDWTVDATLDNGATWLPATWGTDLDTAPAAGASRLGAYPRWHVSIDPSSYTTGAYTLKWRVTSPATVTTSGTPIFISNPGSPAATLAKYIAPAGSNLGSGAIGSPYLTGKKALDVIDAAQSTLDGAIGYLEAGTFTSTNFPQIANPSHAMSRYATFSAAPGVARADVSITSADDYSFERAHLKVVGVTLAGVSGLTRGGSIGGSPAATIVWIDQANLTTGEWLQGDIASENYATDNYSAGHNNTCFSGHFVARGNRSSSTSGSVYLNTRAIINHDAESAGNDGVVHTEFHHMNGGDVPFLHYRCRVISGTAANLDTAIIYPEAALTQGMVVLDFKGINHGIGGGGSYAIYLNRALSRVILSRVYMLGAVFANAPGTDTFTNCRFHDAVCEDPISGDNDLHAFAVANGIEVTYTAGGRVILGEVGANGRSCTAYIPQPTKDAITITDATGFKMGGVAVTGLAYDGFTLTWTSPSFISPGDTASLAIAANSFTDAGDVGNGAQTAALLTTLAALPTLLLQRRRAALATA